jgi:hypothetical protein
MAADEQVWMRFGKHKGRRVCDVPLDYLAWCLRELRGLDPYLRGVMADSIRRREGADDEPADGGEVMAVGELRDRLRDWWRPIAFRNHPDRGGDAKVMAALNSARDELFAALGIE